MIDIIIVNFNAADFLQPLLEALLRPPQKPISRHSSYQVTVVDNASSDNSVEIASQFPAVRVVQRQENDGYAAAVNDGLSSTHNSEILLLNSDILIKPDQVAALWRIWERLDFPAVLGPLHFEEDGWPQQTWGMRPTRAIEKQRRTLEYGLQKQATWARREALKICSRTREVDWVSGSCMFFPRWAVREAGPWDQNFFLFFEDIDWCLRVKEAGLKVYHTPEVQVQHAHGVSVEQDPELAEIEYRISQCYFTAKHMGRWSLMGLRFYLTLKMLGRLVIGGWSGFSRGSSWDILREVWRNPLA